MAGLYPNAPNNRLPYDLDGTIFGQISPTNIVTQITNGTGEAMQGESGVIFGQVPGNSSGYRNFMIFPGLRDITGCCMVNSQTVGSYSYTWQGLFSSTNTTNGFDGTWTNLSFTPGFGQAFAYKPYYRENIQSVLWTGIKALRWGYDCFGGPGGGVWTGLMHLYGKPTAGENPDRLELWHPTLDQRLPASYLDWGDVPRTSTADRTFRVKNLSPTYTANSINLTITALTDTTPTVAAQHTVSADGINFYGSLNIGNLPSGAVSPVYTLRRSTASNAVVSLWSARLRATATSWSV